MSSATAGVGPKQGVQGPWMAPPSPAEVDRGLASYMAEAMHALHVQLQVLSDQEWLKGQGVNAVAVAVAATASSSTSWGASPPGRRRGARGAGADRWRSANGRRRPVRPTGASSAERPSRPPPKGDPPAASWRPRRPVVARSVAPEGARSTRAGGLRAKGWSPQRRPRVRVDPVLEVRPPRPLRVPLLVGGGGARGRRAAPRGVVGQASGLAAVLQAGVPPGPAAAEGQEGAARDPREHPGVAGGEQGPPLGPGLVGAPQREQAEQGAPQERAPRRAGRAASSGRGLSG